MNETRMEHDSMGEIAVPAERLWGAQTQRSLQNFPIGLEKMPPEILSSFALLKKAAALANHELLPSRMTGEKTDAIVSACDAILAGGFESEFPLSVWQTGSGTQTN
ncbi:MAG: class II fumarate hydratase, partial [Clostridia bacterium]|nr:class II fumarate hydratase [Clostridia bacterium]